SCCFLAHCAFDSHAHSTVASSTLFSYSYADHRDLHSFPTRRSSDLLLTPTSVERQKRQFRESLPLVGKMNRAGVGLLAGTDLARSEEHTSELQSRVDLVCRLLLEKKKKKAQ